MTINKPRFRRVGAKTILITVAILSLCIVSATPTAPQKPNVRPSATEVNVVLQGGQFTEVDRMPAESTNQPLVVNVSETQGISIQAQSLDFIYTLTVKNLNRSIVILPESSATMKVKLPPGQHSLSIVQGCGSPIARHRREILLNSIPDSHP